MQKEVHPLQKQVAVKDQQIKDLESKPTATEDKATTLDREVVLAKQTAEEAVNRMKDADSLARFLYRD